MGSGLALARSNSARPPPGEPVNPTARIAGWRTRSAPAWLPWTRPSTSVEMPAAAAPARSTCAQRCAVAGCAGCALTITGQPAASALAVSPPGKFAPEPGAAQRRLAVGQRHDRVRVGFELVGHRAQHAGAPRRTRRVEGSGRRGGGAASGVDFSRRELVGDGLDDLPGSRVGAGHFGGHTAILAAPRLDGRPSYGSGLGLVAGERAEHLGDLVEARALPRG